MSQPNVVEAARKVCGACGLVKTMDRFHKRPDTGRDRRCKDCIRLARRKTKYYSSDKYRQKHNQRLRANRHNHNSQARERRHAAAYGKRYPEKIAARQIIFRAIKTGKLIRPTKCSQCGVRPKAAADGRPQIHAHHHNGYSNALDIIWLCIDCHSSHHRALLTAQMPQKEER